MAPLKQVNAGLLMVLAFLTTLALLASCTESAAPAVQVTGDGNTVVTIQTKGYATLPVGSATVYRFRDTETGQLCYLAYDHYNGPAIAISCTATPYQPYDSRIQFGEEEQ